MEISNLYSTSTILVEYERTTKKVPTMKSLDADKKASKTSEAAPAAAEKVAEKVDFSNVKIEPIFEEMVDFDTFAKSDFRAVKILACEAVPKSKKLLKFTLDDGVRKDRVILSGIHEYYEPEETVIIEDSPSGIQAGKAAEAYVIGYKGAEVQQDTTGADTLWKDYALFEEKFYYSERY